MAPPHHPGPVHHLLPEAPLHNLPLEPVGAVDPVVAPTPVVPAGPAGPVGLAGPVDSVAAPVGPESGRGIEDHGFADGHDAVGPFHHFTGPYGPFGFYANFYNA